jgi:hypothetical protein
MALRSCSDNISAAIVSSCINAITGGVEPICAYIVPRNDVVITYDTTNNPSLIINLAKNGANLTYRITGIKKLLAAGSEIVVTENRPDRWKHKFTFEQFQFAVDNIENVTAIDDVIIFVELKDKQPASTSGTFVALGCKFGLYKSVDTWNANENNGARMLELSSLDGQEEPYERYIVYLTSYTVTKALLEALCS